jgi:ATP-dependent helicase HrpA
LGRIAGERIPRDAFDLTRVPGHLTVTFLVGDDHDNVLAEGKDLDELRRLLADDVRAAIARSARRVEQTGLRRWDVGEIPRTHDDGTVVGYPALVDEGDSVALRVLGTSDEQHEAHWAGVRRLLLLRLPVSDRVLVGRLNRRAGLALASNPYPDPDQLAADCLLAAMDHLMDAHGAPVWDAVAFDALVAGVRAELEDTVNGVLDDVAAILVALAALDRRLDGPIAPRAAGAMADVAAQRDALVPTGFVAAVGAARLADIARYLQAAAVRLDAAATAPARDADRMAQVQRVEHAYGAAVDAAPADGRSEVELERIGWLIEELRVSLFAQGLGTAEAVSVKRILRAIEALAR